MNPLPLRCGFFESDITPPLGCIIPGSFCARFAESIQDPLYARAFVVRSGDIALAVASLDSCGITLDITNRIRHRVCNLIPLQPENVMIMATHAHGAGPTLTWGKK